MAESDNIKSPDKMPDFMADEAFCVRFNRGIKPLAVKNEKGADKQRMISEMLAIMLNLNIPFSFPIQRLRLTIRIAADMAM